MLITKYIEIDMGHRVPNHKSKCRNVHGHRYKIEVGVDDKVVHTKGVSDEGMVIDFGDIKTILMEEIDAKFDHGYTLYKEDAYAYIFDTLKKDGQKIIFVDFIPTAENLAKHWFHLIKAKLAEKKIKIYQIKVWETPTSTATYTIKDEAKEKVYEKVLPKEQQRLQL